MKPVPSNVIGACFSLAAFAVAILAGLVSGNGVTSILVRAVLAMIVCYPVGLIIGLVCQRVVDDQVAGYREANPIADEQAPAEPAPSEKDEEVIVA
ncbi:MAG: hypothetical protein IH804_08495 [Planctomycetes bacterium]|nr:hypothetical protein [Planctomycetota bacterium]